MIKNIELFTLKALSILKTGTMKSFTHRQSLVKHYCFGYKSDIIRRHDEWENVWGEFNCT